MKNLKKVLALVLVVCMAFSLVTFASAATPKVQDYKDASSIKQTEAVDLFTAIGVLKGTDGNFNPTANVTREQAAKIITYVLLTATSADSLKASSSSFSDVASNRWSAASIQYGATKGIINGMGDGTFAPEGNVTGSQFAKMLLTALGYGKNGEYTGANWEINVISDAQRLGILSLSVDVSAPATREQIAQYAFNAYTKCAIVTYSKDTSAYTEKYIGSTTNYYTLAYQQNVTSTTATSNDGLAAHKWLLKGVALNGNVYADSKNTILSTTSGIGLTALTTSSNAKYVASKNATVKYYLNGTELTTGSAAETALIAKIDIDYTSLDMGYITNRGIITTLVDSDTDGLVDKVLVIEKSSAVLTADAVLNTTNNQVSVPGAFANQAKDNVIGWEGLKKGDVVLFYKDVTDVYHVEKCKSITGQMTASSALYLTFGGSIYFGSQLPTSIKAAESTYATYTGDVNNFNTAATIWVDNYNNIVRFKADDAAAKTYAVLIGYKYDELAGTASAKIVKDDGSIGTYTVAPAADATVPNQAAAFLIGDDLSTGAVENTYGYLVTYTVDTNGKITLTKVTTQEYIKTESPMVGATTGYDAKDATIKTNHTPAAASTYYISSTTKVFYFNAAAAYDKDSNPVKVTTGYGATAQVNAGVQITIGTVNSNSTVLSAVFMPVAGTNVGSSDKFAFVPSMTGATASASYVGTTATYTYTVFVDGTSTQLKSTSADLFKMYFAAGAKYTTPTPNTAGNYATSGLFRYTVGANGYVTATYQVGTLLNNTGSNTENRILTPNSETTTVDGSYILLADGTVVFTDSTTKFYLVNDKPLTAAVTEQAIQESTTSTHYKVVNVLLDKDHYSDNLADAVYFTYTVG